MREIAALHSVATSAVERNLNEVEALSHDQRLHQRYLRFRRLGEFAEMERV